MATTLTLTRKLSFDGLYKNVADLTTPNEPIAINVTQPYGAGSGANQLDEFVADNRSVAAAPETIDLTSTLTNAFGVVASFTKIREITIVNKSATAGEKLTLSGSLLDGMSGGNTVKAGGTLTLTTNPLDTETVTVGSKVYTFQTSLTDVNGNVKIGASSTVSATNLAAAMNLSAGAGTIYATSMTKHPTVGGVGASNTVIAVSLTGPTVGNAIATTETLTDGSWGGATLSGGTGAEEFVEAGGVWHRSSPIDGFTVTNTTQDELNVDPGATDTISYDIIVAGVT